MEENKNKYKYYFLNATDGDPFKDNENGYYYICANDLKMCPNVCLFSAILKTKGKFLRLLCKIHHSRKINRIINLPFKRIWYPLYFDFRIKDDSQICFIVNNFQLPFDYLLYLKRKYPKAKFVKIHRDLIQFFYERYPSYTKERCDSLFDLSLSFDEAEASKLGWPHFDEFESKIKLQTTGTVNEYDVFFAGRAKDRLPTLMKVYQKLSDCGLKCYFYITGVPVKKRNDYPGIIFSDKNMSYKDMLIETMRSRCILEVNQQSASGFTSRFLEAVIYNKKLLTNNLSVRKSKFYTPKYIGLFDDSLSFDISLFDENEKVDFGYSNEFSPIHLIKQVDEILSHEDGI